MLIEQSKSAGAKVDAMRRGVPCNENRFFPVRITTQGKPCSGTVLALYGIAVHSGRFPADQSYSYIMRKAWYVSSNLNSKLFRFHCVRPMLHTNSNTNLESI